MITKYWKQALLGGTVLLVAGGLIKAFADDLIGREIAAAGAVLFAIGCLGLLPEAEPDES